MSRLTVGSIGGIPATLNQTSIPAGHTLQINGNVYHDGTGALRLPTGTTGQRPSSPTPGYIRWNTSDGAVEVYTGSTWLQYFGENGTSNAPFTSMANLSSNDPGSGYWYIKFDGTNTEEVYAYKDGNNKYWVMVASITDNTSHGSYTGGSDSWYGNWTSTSTTGNARAAMGNDFKSNHYRGWSANDVLIMQGFATSGTPYDTSTEVGYISGVFTSRGGNMYNMFNNYISLNNHSNIGGTQISGMQFLKGSAQASDNRYRGSSAGELNPNNTWHVSPANCENYTFSMINALGCASNGCNVEHHAWVGQTGNNYSNQNFPEPNWSGSWGINNPGSQNHMYWLFFYA
tara:strand:+ start:15583 stop:16614 length:1032 start_codon:yes stop_codon:yes gene_type:complete